MINTIPQTGRVVTPAAGRYRLDPAGSSVTFRTRHLFGLAGVSGSVPVVNGDIVVEPAVPHADVTVTLDATSLTTGNKRRDIDVHKAKFLDVGKHPKFTFRASTLSRSDDVWSLDGELTVVGVTQPVTLAIRSVEPRGAGFRTVATTRIDRYAFGVTTGKGMAARYLNVELTAVARPT
jgi:polyisoprenoid-binding protein YceI